MQSNWRSVEQASRRGALPGIFWGAVTAVWLALLGSYISMVDAPTWLERATIVTIGAASSVIWLIGIRYLAMWATAAFMFGSRERARERRRGRRTPSPEAPVGVRVALLYCTADDANLEALQRSMAQDHAVGTVILDDSDTPSARRLIDDFVETTGIEVMRRRRRSGFKAGNLNHGIMRLIDRFDYFVVLDSDEVLPSHFVSECLRTFAADPQVGIVQARHHASAGKTAFTTAFAGIVGTHIGISQAARSRIGFPAFLGHGAMFSAVCYRAVGPIPEIVTEDLAFSVEARLAGFRTAYDHELVCEEDYPIDYHAFRTQHAKLVEGTTEFLRLYWRRIVRSRLGFFEKLDLLLEQLTFPALAGAGLVLMLANLLLAGLGGAAQQPLWAIAVTGLCAAAPLLPETVRVTRNRGLVAGGAFLAKASALYGSTLLVTLRATGKVIFGGAAAFRVTPKTERRAGRWGTVVALWLELVATAGAVSVALALTGSLLPALPVVGAAAAALYFAFLGTGPARTPTPVRGARFSSR